MVKELSRQQRRVLILLGVALLLGAGRLGFSALSRGDVEVHLVTPAGVEWPPAPRGGSASELRMAFALPPPGATEAETSSVAEPEAETAPPATNGGSATGKTDSTLLDPNTATSEELQTLPGIGPVLAARIIEYRETVGKFRTIDDLLAVKGIGEKTLAKIRPYLEIKE